MTWVYEKKNISAVWLRGKVIFTTSNQKQLYKSKKILFFYIDIWLRVAHLRKLVKMGKTRMV